GLGIFEEPTAESMDRIERFFFDRGAPAMHEVSPLAGVATIDLLGSRGYRPLERRSVLYQTIEGQQSADDGAIKVRAIGLEETQLRTQVNARGWAHDHPEFQSFLEDFGGLIAAREQSVCFLAELDSQTGAAGVLCL